MGWRGLAVGLWALALAGGAARAMPIDDDQVNSTGGPAKPELPVAGVVTNPDWERKPSGEDLARYYPFIGQYLNLEGRAVISCTVTSTGDLSNCSTASETPPGLGFGDAALKMSGLFKMKPQTVDGVPVGGATVNVPIHFALAGESLVPVAVGGEAPENDTPASEPSPGALALAHRLAVATIGDGILHGLVQQMSAMLAQQGETAETRLATEALQQAADATKPDQIEHLARMYASSFSEAELTQIVAFQESPAGQAWRTRMKGVGSSYMTKLVETVRMDARDRICAKIRCLATAKPPTPTTAVK
jgi:TonB family protein